MGHILLATVIVQLLWCEYVSGVTVVNAVEGFGASRVFYFARLVDAGASASVVVEWLETPERFDAIWPQLEPLVRHAMVTVESVDMLSGPHHPLRRLSSDATVAEVMRTDMVTVASSTFLRDVVALMRAQDRRFVPVVDGEELVGVITNSDLVSRGGLAARLELLDAAGGEALQVADATAVDVMTVEPVHIMFLAPLTEAVRLMLDLCLKRLFVVDGGSLVGLVSRLDLLCTVADVAPEEGVVTAAHGGRMVGEVVVAAVLVVHLDTSVADVVDAVVSTRFNRVVVVDECRRVLGVVSDAEVLCRVGGE